MDKLHFTTKAEVVGYLLGLCEDIESNFNERVDESIPGNTVTSMVIACYTPFEMQEPYWGVKVSMYSNEKFAKIEYNQRQCFNSTCIVWDNSWDDSRSIEYIKSCIRELIIDLGNI